MKSVINIYDIFVYVGFIMWKKSILAGDMESSSVGNIKLELDFKDFEYCLKQFSYVWFQHGFNI